MARGGSRDDRKRQRANDDLAALDKAIRRGQRPDALGAVDTWLELPEADRAQHFDLVQGLVGRALDEMRTRAPANPLLLAWSARLERAPQLVRAQAEPHEAGLERWWTLLRSCLLGRLFPVAQRLWPCLAASAQASPRLARALEAWLAAGADGVPEAMLVTLRATIARLGGAGTADGSSASQPDPRLGMEPIRQRETLAASATDADVRAFVESLFAERGASLSQLRQAIRGLSNATAALVWKEAAPFLLRDALARDTADSLRGFAEAMENVAPGHGLGAEIETALRCTLAQLAATPVPEFRQHVARRAPVVDERSSLFARLALALLRDEASAQGAAARIEAALLLQSPDRMAPTSELVLLLTRLLSRPAGSPVSAALWVWALGMPPADVAVDTTLFEAALERSATAVCGTPRVLLRAISRHSAHVRMNIFDAATAMLSTQALGALLERLWPEADHEVKRHLVDVFESLVERHDRQADPRNKSDTKLPFAIPPDLLEDFEDLLGSGDSIEEAVATMLHGLPPPLAVMLRKPLLDHARRGPPPPSAASIAMWKALGPEIVGFAPKLLSVGLRCAQDPERKSALVKAVVMQDDQFDACIARGHRTYQDGGPPLLKMVLGVLGERFGDSLDTWTRAYEQQRDCRCRYTSEVGLRMVAHEVAAGLAPSENAREARRRFPEIGRALAEARRTIAGQRKKAVAAAKKEAAAVAKKQAAVPAAKAKKQAEPAAKAKKQAEPAAKAKKQAEPAAKVKGEPAAKVVKQSPAKQEAATKQGRIL